MHEDKGKQWRKKGISTRKYRHISKAAADGLYPNCLPGLDGIHHEPEDCSQKEIPRLFCVRKLVRWLHGYDLFLFHTPVVKRAKSEDRHRLQLYCFPLRGLAGRIQQAGSGKILGTVQRERLE